MQLCVAKRLSRYHSSDRASLRPSHSSSSGAAWSRAAASRSLRKINPVRAQGHVGHGEATTQTQAAAAAGSTRHVPPADSTAHPPPGLDMQPLVGSLGGAQEAAAAPHSFTDELDDFEAVAQQLPLIKAELGDQQALLVACNEFLEDMAERHLNLLLQQQTAQRLAASRPNTPTAAGVDALTLQAYAQLQEQVQEVSAQLELQRQQAEELAQQKDALNKQLRVVTMEREELKQQLLTQAGTAAAQEDGTPAAEEAAASHAALQETLTQLTQAQEKLLAAEERLGEAMDSNKQLTEQLQAANSVAEAAKASALAATSTASAQAHAQLQEASARAAALEAQLATATQHGTALSDSNKLLQQQLREAHAQGGRLIGMNRQLMQHAAQLEQRHTQQAALVSALKEEKAAQAAELARIFIMLQEMQGAQQRQQQLQQQLLQMVAQQQEHMQEAGGAPAATATANSSTEEAASPAQAAGTGEDAGVQGGGGGGLVRALSGAVLGAALPLVSQFLR